MSLSEFLTEHLVSKNIVQLDGECHWNSLGVGPVVEEGIALYRTGESQDSKREELVQTIGTLHELLVGSADSAIAYALDNDEWLLHKGAEERLVEALVVAVKELKLLDATPCANEQLPAKQDVTSGMTAREVQAAADLLFSDSHVKWCRELKQMLMLIANLAARLHEHIHEPAADAHPVGGGG